MDSARREQFMSLPQSFLSVFKTCKWKDARLKDVKYQFPNVNNALQMHPLLLEEEEPRFNPKCAAALMPWKMMKYSLLMVGGGCHWACHKVAKQPHSTLLHYVLLGNPRICNEFHLDTYVMNALHISPDPKWDAIKRRVWFKFKLIRSPHPLT